MPLIKSPTLTAAKLAANRLNARRSTGPRTWRGKGCVTLNALKHGRYASGKFFRTHLARTREDAALYDWFYQEILQNLVPGNRQERQEAEDLAREVWCFFRAGRQEGVNRGRRAPGRSSVWCLLRIPTRLTGGRGTNPRYAVKSIDTHLTFPSRFDVPVGRQGVRLRFWVRRQRRSPLRLNRTLVRALARALHARTLSAAEVPDVEGTGGDQRNQGVVEARPGQVWGSAADAIEVPRKNRTPCRPARHRYLVDPI